MYKKRKNIFYVLLIVVLIAFISVVFLIIKKYTDNQIIATTTTIIDSQTEEKTIVLDPGHGYPDEGASSDDNVTEAEINLKIAYKVKELLEQSGYKVILTRVDKNGIYDNSSKTIRQKKVSDIKNRVKIGNKSNADIFVSIHLNKIPQKQYWGWQTFYKQDNEESKKLAECLQKGLDEVIKKPNKRKPLKINNIYIIDNVKIPISLVECGFLSNENEEKILQTEEYQSKLAEGIFVGINNYFNK